MRPLVITLTSHYLKKVACPFPRYYYTYLQYKFSCWLHLRLRSKCVCRDFGTQSWFCSFISGKTYSVVSMSLRMLNKSTQITQIVLSYWIMIFQWPVETLRYLFTNTLRQTFPLECKKVFRIIVGWSCCVYPNIQISKDPRPNVPVDRGTGSGADGKFQCKDIEGGQNFGATKLREVQNLGSRLEQVVGMEFSWVHSFWGGGQKCSAWLSRGGQILSVQDFQISKAPPPPTCK